MINAHAEAQFEISQIFADILRLFMISLFRVNLDLKISSLGYFFMLYSILELILDSERCLYHDSEKFHFWAQKFHFNQKGPDQSGRVQG